MYFDIGQNIGNIDFDQCKNRVLFGHCKISGSKN